MTIAWVRAQTDHNAPPLLVVSTGFAHEQVAPSPVRRIDQLTAANELQRALLADNDVHEFEPGAIAADRFLVGRLSYELASIAADDL